MGGAAFAPLRSLSHESKHNAAANAGNTNITREFPRRSAGADVRRCCGRPKATIRCRFGVLQRSEPATEDGGCRVAPRPITVSRRGTRVGILAGDRLLSRRGGSATKQSISPGYRGLGSVDYGASWLEKDREKRFIGGSRVRSSADSCPQHWGPRVLVCARRTIRTQEWNAIPLRATAVQRT
ncbi:hypothetical protein Mal15_14040 [Stieleria maiorica]|uniref:Uncharacterized protein n=1 Tax=Stieleria maiorica TaxID=2795974 RepID=A0A5B9MCM1_9BACT|nr:hypothetical protein Mal15_14040 [Stieleria maiorica]